jgi:hypothetical protein
MARIRKYTRLIDKELLDKTPYQGIHFNVRNMERTLCRCGHVCAGKIYECPDCGNTNFAYDVHYGAVLHSTEYEIEFIGNDFYIFNYDIKVLFKNEVSLTQIKQVVISCEAGVFNAPRWGNTLEEIGIPLMEANLDKLPEKIKSTLEKMKRYNVQGYVPFKALLNPTPNLRALIKNEDKDNPLFIGAVISRFFNYIYGGSDDIPFTSINQCCTLFNIPAEFNDFIRKNPKTVLDRISYYGKRQFDVGENWHLVPQEIKNIMWYYYENGIIQFYDYLRLGSINKTIISNTSIISSFLKRYMMQFKNNVIHKINEVHQYLINNNIEVNKNTLDYKFYTQHKNIVKMKKNVLRSEFDVDNFINGIGINAVEATKVLASNKRVLKPKSK